MPFSQRTRLWTAGAAAIGLLLLLAAITRLGFAARYDEKPHQAFSKHIAEHPTWHTILTYEGSQNAEAKAPLLFIIGAIYGSVAGFDLVQLRLLALLFGIAGIPVFLCIARLFDAQRSYLWASIALLPYYTILSVTFMTDVATLVFLLIGALGYLAAIEHRSWSWLGLGIFGMTCASYIRVDACYILAAIGMACLWHRKMSWSMAIALALPALLRLPLVIAWGGLAAPPAQERALAVKTGFSVSHFTFVLAVLGMYFWPFVLENLKHARWRLIAALAVAALCAMVLPHFDREEVDYYGGLLRSFAFASHAPVWAINIGMVGLALGGTLVVLRLLLDGARSNPRWTALRLICLIGIAMQTVRGGVIYERYLLLVTPFILGLLITTARWSWAIWLWIVYSATVLALHLIQHKVL